jgi:hypothetical protein
MNHVHCLINLAYNYWVTEESVAPLSKDPKQSVYNTLYAYLAANTTFVARAKFTNYIT